DRAGISPSGQPGDRLPDGPPGGSLGHLGGPVVLLAGRGLLEEDGLSAAGLLDGRSGSDLPHPEIAANCGLGGGPAGGSGLPAACPSTDLALPLRSLPRRRLPGLSTPTLRQARE